MTYSENQHNEDDGEIEPHQEIIGMELKYERVNVVFHNETVVNNTWHKKIHCARPNCTHRQQYMGNMETHLNWRIEIKKRNDVNCPRCPEIFAHLCTLNRHIHFKHCSGIDYTNASWVTIWANIRIVNS